MSDRPIPSLQPPADLPYFPALATLECESIEHAPTLLEQVKCSLVEFNLIARSWRATPTKGTVQALYSALATNCTHASLQRIAVQKPAWLRSEVIGPDQLNLYLVSGEELRPLLCFRNLVVVSLSHTAGVDLDDEAVLNLAHAWPCLQSLWLPSDPKYRIKPRVTLEGIYAFAKYCPNLEDLEILFDATVTPELKIRGKIGSMRRVSQNSLGDLDVAYSPIGSRY
ncbi:hypothetical protein DFH06DRAFT_1009770 [Mycena polygramma]|nr:hypothetical protein DFH06DRAFT_1009770 [Mycena polygramma]